MSDSKIMTGSSHNLKLVVVGDGAVGKTCLLTRYGKGNFPHEYIPTVFEGFVATGKVDDLPTAMVCFWDTAAGEDYARLRPLSYPDTDVLLLCFSIDYISSFDNTSTYWQQELKHYCPNVPILLLGNKIDLRNDQKTIDQMKEKNQSMITYEQGVEMSEKIGARKYLECSSLDDIGVKEVFEEIVRISNAYPVSRKTKKKCQLI